MDPLEASEEKLRVELEVLNSGRNYEVVVLEADDEAALRKTHGRYFSSATSVQISTKYDGVSSSSTKTWDVRDVSSGWVVEVDGHRTSYPTKESAVAAAAKDARIWKNSSGKECSIRIVEKSGNFSFIDIN
ncbi:hypothetical protein [Stenotrophomonas cyclobalanopsidis]|uniref:hypothetical protein n=1 Tax=Stenotrophomonas cyclobalanopsidis TaxID=2771362 RepID=UPI003460A99B